MSSANRNLISHHDHILCRLQKSSVSLCQSQQIVGQLLTNEHLRTNSLLTGFIRSCAQHQRLDCASQFLRSLPQLNSTLWNLLIRLSLESGLGHEFMGVYVKILRENVTPDKIAFSTILRACANSAIVKAGETVHCQIRKMGFEFDVFLQTGLLDFYSKVGDLSSAKQVFSEMPEKDVIAHNAMIAAFSKHGQAVDARKLFDQMPNKTSASWNTMVSCYCKQDDLHSAREIFERNPVKNVVSWNAMIDGYCKSGQLMSARELFDLMGSAKNSVTWNTMISGYVHSREFARALSMFQEMQMENVKPTEVTMSSLLSASAHLGALHMGKWIHAYIRHHKLRIDVVLGNALIDMYSKCGNIETALEVFHGLSGRNIFCWNSIIVGLGMHGHGREGIDAFLAMKKERISPDGVTFVGLLCGCSHSGLVSEGRHYFSQMIEHYGIEPGIEHYGCMVDLLGRAGLLKEALELIGAMPMKPNSAVFGGLLRACRIHKKTNLTEQVTRCLLELDPYDGGNYVFLSNAYASLNRWDDVEICRRMMLERGVHKTPGCSLIEVNNVVHEFVVGDSSHPQYAQTIAFLDEVASKLRDHGHEPDIGFVLHDIEEEEKENAVKYHSEKIAIAFGLMSIRQGKPIRIVKNLRVCIDCHATTKLIAKLFNREIIVRDRNRFHHFKDGSCSCNDYW